MSYRAELTAMLMMNESKIANGIRNINTTIITYLNQDKIGVLVDVKCPWAVHLLRRQYSVNSTENSPSGGMGTPLWCGVHGSCIALLAKLQVWLGRVKH